MKLYNPFSLLTRFEWILWLLSVTVVTCSFFFGNSDNALSIFASLVGVTALIFVAKGNVYGQVLTVIFSLLYAAVSWQFKYYGEMITYLGMTTPIALMSVVTWLRNPCQGETPVVKVAHLSRRMAVLMIGLTVTTTVGFYFILAYFNTANLWVSTVSIATSFLASFMMLFRSPYYALAYGANDIVLILLWTLATLETASYLPMLLCFFMFLCNDIYGFLNWQKMKNQQYGIDVIK